MEKLKDRGTQIPGNQIMYDVTLWVFSVELASCHFPGTDNSDMVTYIHIL